MEHGRNHGQNSPLTGLYESEGQFLQRQSIHWGYQSAHLPPRSRSGCCVSLGTGHVGPAKSNVMSLVRNAEYMQCVRLNHECDYTAKLAFKDETRKIIEKYVSDSEEWNGRIDAIEAIGTSPVGSDILPPFSTLTTEEERQEKAKHRPPGTYYVVANYSSFGNVNRAHNSEQSRGFGRPSNTIVDQNTIILGSFEDSWDKSLEASRLPSHGNVSSSADHSQPKMDVFREAGTPTSRQGTTGAPPVTHSEASLSFHWRLIVRSQIFELGQDIIGAALGEEDILEATAHTFPALHNAIFALSSLSLAERQGEELTFAIGYHSAAVNLLRALPVEQELASNGSFLAHYVLLLYGIAVVEKAWIHHMDALKSIIAYRRLHLIDEPFLDIIQSIHRIDIFALLSCSGSGSLILEHVNGNSMIHSQAVRQSLPMLSSYTFSNTECHIIAPILDLTTTMLTLWTRIGQLANTIRHTIRQTQQEAITRGASGIEALPIASFSQEMSHIRELIQSKWAAHQPAAVLQSDHAHDRAESIRQVYGQAQLVYHSIMLFSYSSIWLVQPLALRSGHDEVQSSVTSVLHLVNELVTRNQLHQRGAVFALLLAGSASARQEDGESALSLLRSFETVAIGQNTKSTRMLLEAVLWRKDELRNHGFDDHVDWISLAQELGRHHLIHIGL